MSKTETPDIVERLQTAIDDRGKGSVWGYAGLLEDAAAEIERLRSELAKQSQWPVLHRRHKGASMTHPLPDKAVEAGARFLCAEMSDDWREGAAYWKHVAQGFITALAAKGLVLVPREPTQAMLDAIVTYPAELVAARNDPAYTAQMQAVTLAERALAAQRYRAMIEAAREGHPTPPVLRGQRNE